MSVTIKGKKCRNIAEQVAFNDYRIRKLIDYERAGDYVMNAEVKESGDLLELTQYNGESETTSKVQFRGGSSGPSTYIKEISGGTTSIPKYYAFDQNNTQVAEWLPVEDNPGQDPTNPDLTSIKIGNGKFNIPLVKGNPSESGTLTLNKLKINNKIYNVSSGGEPAAYLKNASVSDNTLTITKKDDTEVTYTPNLDGYMTLSGNQVIYTKVLNSTSGDRSINLDLTGGQPGIEVKESGSDHVDYRIVYGPKSISVANIPEGSASVYSNFSFPTTLGNYTFATTSDLSSKLDASKSTIQTTAPTSAISDGGIHIVILSSEPATKYNGYIYLINEA